MAIPIKGTRRIVVGGVTYRWRAGYDRLAWDKGYITGVRIVVQAVPPGQILLTEFMASRRIPDDQLSQPFTPGFARKLILAGIAKGWRPGERVRKPVWLEKGELREAMENQAGEQPE